MTRKCILRWRAAPRKNEEVPGRAIFLSYASQDADAAQRICAALQSAGLEVWFDQSELRGGDAWDQKIRRQIRDCGLFVPIISANTDSRPEGYFRLEWHLAEQRTFLMAHDRPFIVPVVIDQTSEAGARVPERFRERQWTRLAGGQTPSDFLARVAQLLGAEAAPASAPGRSPTAAPSADTREKSVAVLPFINLSGDKENEYFSDGVSDELLTVLQKIPGLRVAARTSAFSFKASQATAQHIGQALGSAHLVEGSVQRSGNRVKISARLSRSATGETIWSRSFTREMTDVFAVQEEIAVAILSELRGHLAGTDAEAPALVAQAGKGGTRHPQAYQEYLLGRHLLNQFSETPVRQAVERFKRACELDPQFALGWALLGQAHGWILGYASMSAEAFADQLEHARAASGRALALEPDLPEALSARFLLEYGFDYDWKKAEATIARALELAPNDPDVLVGACRIAMFWGDFDRGIAIAQKAVSLDPISAKCRTQLAIAYMVADRLEDARRETLESARINPGSHFAKSGVGLCLIREGRFAEAEQSVADAGDGWSVLWVRSLALFGQHRREAAQAVLDKLILECAASAAVQIASVYAFAGESDQAFEWLERARRQRDSGLGAMARSSFLEKIRDDPRWAPFWESVGLPASVAQRHRH